VKLEAIGLAVAAVLLSLPLLAEETTPARAKVTFSDPAGDVTGDPDDKQPIDVVGIDLSSDGEFIVVGTTLAEVAKPAGLLQALVVGVAFDVDNNRKTGGRGFGGSCGDVPGIDFESEMLTSFEEGAPSKSSSASVISVDAKGNQASVLRFTDAPSTPANGKTYTGRIAYSSIGGKPGQTVRVIVRELNDRGETCGMFPEALLTLK
jgi:hypothetical protein